MARGGTGKEIQSVAAGTFFRGIDEGYGIRLSGDEAQPKLLGERGGKLFVAIGLGPPPAVIEMDHQQFDTSRAEDLGRQVEQRYRIRASRDSDA